MNKLIMMIGAAAMLPLGVLAAASTPPSTLVDLTTNGSNPSGSVASSSDYSSTYNANQYNGTKAFDGVENKKSENRWLAAKADNMWVIYTFNVATVVDAIRIYLPNYDTDAARAPKDWTFLGSNDKSTWNVVLYDTSTQGADTDWTKGGSRYYKFANTTAYKYYKFNCTANNGDDNCMQVLEIEFYCVGTDNSKWTGGGTTDLLSDVANWGGTMPGCEYGATINNTGSTPAVVPDGLTVYRFLYVGSSSGSNAKLVQTNGSVKASEGMIVGNQSNSHGEYTMTGGACSFSQIFIGYEQGSSGLYKMTGGTCAATVSSGTAVGMSVGRCGTGTLEISGAGTVLTAKDVRVGFTYKGNKGTGTLVVTNGGEIATTQLYAGAGASATNQATVTFNGGKLTATAANAAFLKDFSNIQLEAGGLTINTQGKNIGINNCTFNVTGNGKITVVGGGTVTFTNVKVNMSAKPSGAYVFAETDGTFSGLPNLGGVKGCKVSLSDDLKRVTVSPRGLIISFF